MRNLKHWTRRPIGEHHRYDIKADGTEYSIIPAVRMNGELCGYGLSRTNSSGSHSRINADGNMGNWHAGPLFETPADAVTAAVIAHGKPC